MNVRLFTTAAAVALTALAWTGAAAAGNPHGTPPGQDKAAANAGVQASGQAQAKADVKVHGHAGGNAEAKGHGQAKARGHVESHAKGSASAHGKTHAAVRVEVHGQAAGQGGATVQASVHGRSAVKTEAGAKAKVGAGHGNHEKVASAVALGVKPSNVTAKNTIAAASSNQTKLYGNGKTAGQIATEAGFGAAMLYGPGNSQPHKVMCGPRLVDVHALKAHGGACKAAEAGGEVKAGVVASTQTPTAAQAVAGVKTETTPSTVPTTTGTAQAAPAQAAPAQAAPAQASQTPGSGVLNAGTQLVAAARPAAQAVAAPARAGTLPFTGLALWVPVAFGVALIVAGYGLRRRANALT